MARSGPARRLDAFAIFAGKAAGVGRESAGERREATNAHNIRLALPPSTTAGRAQVSRLCGGTDRDEPNQEVEVDANRVSSFLSDRSGARSGGNPQSEIYHPDWAVAVRSKRAPGYSRGLLFVQRCCCLPAGLDAGSAARAVSRAAAKDVTGGDELDPKRAVALVVRGGVGLAQRIQAVLRRTRGCGGESRQLEHHPRTGIQFRHAEGQRRPFGGYLVLGTRSYVG